MAYCIYGMPIFPLFFGARKKRKWNQCKLELIKTIICWSIVVKTH